VRRKTIQMAGRRWLWLVLPLLGLLAAGCGSRVAPNEPPEIVYGEDVCDQCNMIISDDRFAAAAVVEEAPGDYAYRLFDDIGDMLAYREEHPDLDFVTLWVHDYNTREWLDAATAAYVVAVEIRSPMAYGFAAFATPEAAVAFAQRFPDGQVLTWEELQQYFVDRYR